MMQVAVQLCRFVTKELVCDFALCTVFIKNHLQWVDGCMQSQIIMLFFLTNYSAIHL